MTAAGTVSCVDGVKLKEVRNQCDNASSITHSSPQELLQVSGSIPAAANDMLRKKFPSVRPLQSELL